MARANADNPDLSIWVTGFEAIAGSNFTRVNFKVSSFDVDRHNLAMIAFLNLGPHLRFINLIAPSSELFFTVAGLSDCHGLALVLSSFLILTGAIPSKLRFALIAFNR
jgi:hypothetical protein